MTLQRLNPNPTEYPNARGFMAPYVRVATHIGYCIAWVNGTTDEEWDADSNTTEGALSVAPEDAATRQKVIADLYEASGHLINTADFSVSVFVNAVQTERMHTLQDQLEWLSNNLADVRTDALGELQMLADNLAYAAAEYERHVAGNQDVSEGRNA